MIHWIRLSAGKANAMNSRMLDLIERAFDEFEASEARAAVVTGYDNYFSAGFALPELVGLDRPQMRDFVVRFCAIMERVLRCPRPVVAAVNGHAIAGGCVLALQADWRVGADGEHKIGLNEVMNGIGLPGIVTETLRLRVPPSSLTPIALEGRLYSPKEARELGLLDELVPAAELEARAAAKAEALAKTGKEAFAQVKRQIIAPALAAVATEANVENWLDSFMAGEGRGRVAAVVEKLKR
jgi:enoyl-CoA hydratase